MTVRPTCFCNITLRPSFKVKRSLFYEGEKGCPPPFQGFEVERFVIGLAVLPAAEHSDPLE